MIANAPDSVPQGQRGVFGPRSGGPNRFLTRGPAEPNVGAHERIASSVAGAALVLFGLNRRSVPGLLLAGLGGGLLYRGLSGRCAAYRWLGIDTAHGGRARPEDYFGRGTHVEESITIQASPEEVFRFWRQLENLPKFMSHLESVSVIDSKRSRWVAKAPAHHTVEWEAQIINEEPPTLLAWRSVEGSDVPNTGSVRFLPAPGGRGTEVKVVLEYLPPAGRVGWAIARLFREEPAVQVRDDLRRMKQILEVGEIATTEGQPSGRGRGAPAEAEEATEGREPSPRRASREDNDVVRASEESFPASDAPGWGSRSV